MQALYGLAIRSKIGQLPTAEDPQEPRAGKVRPPLRLTQAGSFELSWAWKHMQIANHGNRLVIHAGHCFWVTQKVSLPHRAHSKRTSHAAALEKKIAERT